MSAFCYSSLVGWALDHWTRHSEFDWRLLGCWHNLLLSAALPCLLCSGITGQRLSWWGLFPATVWVTVASGSFPSWSCPPPGGSRGSRGHGHGSPTADRALVSDPVHHCYWTSAKRPLHTSLLNAEKIDCNNSGVAVKHHVELLLVHSW